MNIQGNNNSLKNVEYLGRLMTLNLSYSENCNF